LFSAAVVLTNQVTTKLTGGSTFLAPALGESWAHACTSRVMLSWENGQRVATLVKSPSRKSDCKTFQVTSAGVRGTGKKRPRPEGADNAENRGVNAMESR
jgi:RAD51-like protein 2